MRFVSIMVLVIVLAPTTALAKEIAVCGESKGYGYFPQTGINTITGWHPDGISQGRFTLTSDGNKFDILYTDGSGAVVSSTGDGGEVILVGRTAHTITFAVNYPGMTIETFTFIKSSDGNEVIWSSNKYGAPVPKIAAYRAECTLLDLSE